MASLVVAPLESEREVDEVDSLFFATAGAAAGLFSSWKEADWGGHQQCRTDSGKDSAVSSSLAPVEV